MNLKNSNYIYTSLEVSLFKRSLEYTVTNGMM